MKIEPRKTASVPKYAAVLASAVLLTGCGYDGEIATDGTAPAPNPDVELMGEAQLMPDLTEISGQMTTANADTTATTAITTEEPILLEGEALPYDGDGYVTACTDAAVTTAPEQPRLAGVIQVNPDALPQQNDDPVMLDGDVAFAPDFRTDTVADKADYYAPIYQSMFSEHGIIMNRCSRKTNWFDIGFYEELESVKDKTEVIFFDGSVSDQGVTMREWLSSLCTKHFDWGCLLEDHAPEAAFTRIIFVDISADTEPAAVARDLGL